MDSYENLGPIGEGTYGLVIKARHRVTGQLVAIKKFKESDESESVRKTALREIRLLKQLKHENIVSLIEVFRRNGKLYLVFEYVDRTVLQELESNPQGLDKLAIKKIIFQLLTAINFIHTHNVIHRDVKPENLLLSKNGIVKVCDLGFARTMARPGSNYTDYVATRWYRAPELLVGDTNYGRAVDVWAVGALMCELIDGQPLFPGESDLDQLHCITKCLGPLPASQIEMFNRNSLYVGMSLPQVKANDGLAKRFPQLERSALAFLKSCLRYDPQERDSAAKLLQHSYFAGFTEWFSHEQKSAIQKDRDDQEESFYQNQRRKQKSRQNNLIQDFRNSNNSRQQANRDKLQAINSNQSSQSQSQSQFPSINSPEPGEVDDSFFSPPRSPVISKVSVSSPDEYKTPASRSDREREKEKEMEKMRKSKGLHVSNHTHNHTHHHSTTHSQTHKSRHSDREKERESKDRDRDILQTPPLLSLSHSHSQSHIHTRHSTTDDENRSNSLQLSISGVSHSNSQPHNYSSSLPPLPMELDNSDANETAEAQHLKEKEREFAAFFVDSAGQNNSVPPASSVSTSHSQSKKRNKDHTNAAAITIKNVQLQLQLNQPNEESPEPSRNNESRGTTKFAKKKEKEKEKERERERDRDRDRERDRQSTFTLPLSSIAMNPLHNAMSISRPIQSHNHNAHHSSSQSQHPHQYNHSSLSVSSQKFLTPSSSSTNVGLSPINNIKNPATPPVPQGLLTSFSLAADFSGQSKSKPKQKTGIHGASQSHKGKFRY